MRISTEALYRGGVAAILEQQSLLVRLQQKLASGQALSTAAENPAAFTEALQLDNRLQEIERYSATLSTAQHRLRMEEAALVDVSENLQRIRDLTLQANNASLGASDRQAIGAELSERLQELLAQSNREDGSGHFLFAGAGGRTPPFSLQASGVVYGGDQQVRQLTVAAGRQVAEGDSGAEVFLNMRNGVGPLRLSADASNTGSGVMAQVSMTDAANWDGDTYRLSFNAGNYEVRDSANVVVAGGAFQSGSTITVAGVAITLNGQPADGDGFTLSASEAQDIFSTVQAIADTVNGVNDAAARQNRLFNGLQDLDRALEHLNTVRARVGGRLQVLDDVSTAHESLSVQLQSARADLRDVDYAAAISELQQRLVSLQAAQQAFLKVQGLSLFDHLR